MEKEYTCEVYAKWKEKKMGVISFEDSKKKKISYSVPPEYMGHCHEITPEDLFLASLQTCLSSFFFNMASRARLKFISFDSCARGILKKVGDDIIFSDIILNVYISVKNEKEAHKAKRAMEIAERGCYISHSIKAKVIINTNIKLIKKEEN